MNDAALHLKVKKLRDDAVIPTRGSALAAGYDLYACLSESVTIDPGRTVPVGTGLSMAFPEGWFAAIFARSGLATKQGLAPSNKVGVIDADYRGEVIVAIHNDSEEERSIRDGDRIAQIVIMPCMDVCYQLCDSLDETQRGEGGFGHSGIR